MKRRAVKVFVAQAAEQSSPASREQSNSPGPSLALLCLAAGLVTAQAGELRTWIAGGAPWKADPIDPSRYTTPQRAGSDWWSFQPLRQTRPPQVKQTDWPRNEVDRFVLRRLEDSGLAPSQPAEPGVLVRRLYYDLIGLPAPPELIEAFAADPSDSAYAAIVEQLLASPHHGERWARHWLDVARFGESNGFERNDPRTNFWPYRDWVIDALNADMPYDRFVRMQLAGDIIEGGVEGAAAAGFLVAGVHNTVVGSSERMKRLARQDELEEIASTVAQAFLGLTIHCARCHDHKFDPIRSEEYYRFISALDGVQHGQRDVLPRELADQLARLREATTELESELAEIDRSARRAILEKRKESGGKPAPDVPQPVAAWGFDSDFQDSHGHLHGEAHGNARVQDGALVLDGQSAYVTTAPLDKDLEERTLEAWVLLDNLDQRGGGVMSIETRGGEVFDAIVFGERDPRRWMAGSDLFRRTQPFQGAEEREALEQPVHVTIVYRRDGTIRGYRNGLPYGSPYKTGFVLFKAGESHVVFGMRHSPAGGNRMLAGRILRANLYDLALDDSAIAASAGRDSEFVSEQSIRAFLPEPTRTRRTRLQRQLTDSVQRRQALESSKRNLYTVTASDPGAMRVHLRGGVTDFGPEVSPGGVRAIATLSPDFGLPPNAADAQRRLKLADWITHPANPLFDRVLVNRLWQHHFGTGIVDTPSDFGFNGGRPSHPELLDWLATQLREHGYRLKSLHRLIVLSATYRQASAPDPDAFAKDAGNRLLWRYSPRRVDAEVLRDSMLQAAGVLNLARGGPGFVDVTITPNNGTTYYEPIDPEDPAAHRRTVYRFTPRGGRGTVLDTFDCPDPSVTAPQRSVTTTPLQALSLLNSSFALRMADQFAARLHREVGEQPLDQVRRAWQLALGRLPDADEERLAVQLVHRHGLTALGRTLFNTNEFVMIE